MVNELSGPPKEGQELVVIQSPDTMRPSWFQPASNVEISLEALSTFARKCT